MPVQGGSKKARALSPKDLSRLEKTLNSIYSDQDAGLAAIIEILEAPSHRSDRARLLLIKALTHAAMLGDKATRIAPALLGLIRKREDTASEMAGLTLASIGPYEEALPELINLLSNESYSIRGSAAGAIGRLGKAGAPGISALQAALKKEIFRTVRAEIVAALANISTHSCLPALRLAARDPYKSVREAAKGAIRDISKSGD